jgi:hypothetical protein
MSDDPKTGFMPSINRAGLAGIDSSECFAPALFLARLRQHEVGKKFSAVGWGV